MWICSVVQDGNVRGVDGNVVRYAACLYMTARMNNDEVLKRMNEDRELMVTIKCKETTYLGDIRRGTNYKLLQLIRLRKTKDTSLKV